MIATVAASGAMALAWPVSAAFAADAGASADGVAVGSPGVVSGNSIQLPVDIPVNLCGNTIDVVGLLNTAAGNACANESGDEKGESTSSSGAVAHGSAEHSPGVLSGDVVQVPIHVPVNVSGNSINVVGVGNSATGNTSVNGGEETPSHPVTTAPEPPAPVKSHPAAPSTPRPAPDPVSASLAHTGTDLTTPAAVGSAALLLTGTILYRRFRPTRMH
ncbi:chaplin family protein [Streptomyces sp. NPDC048106]|uniref:chaplin n=1 Tax=Streptomyces sp. NPDC048106 TaxID=3155750 RepID=UPI0034560B2E